MRNFIVVLFECKPIKAAKHVFIQANYNGSSVLLVQPPLYTAEAVINSVTVRHFTNTIIKTNQCVAMNRCAPE